VKDSSESGEDGLILRLREVVVKRITVVKFGVKQRKWECYRHLWMSGYSEIDEDE